MFYNMTIKVFTVGEGYVDDSGVYHEGDKEYIKDIECDVQPFSSELLYKNYGYQEQCTKRIFCDLDDSVALDNLIEYESKQYKIVKIIDWDSYVEVMVNDI